jgi:hypothetical protein
MGEELHTLFITGGGRIGGKGWVVAEKHQCITSKLRNYETTKNTTSQLEEYYKSTRTILLVNNNNILLVN